MYGFHTPTIYREDEVFVNKKKTKNLSNYANRQNLILRTVQLEFRELTSDYLCEYSTKNTSFSVILIKLTDIKRR